MTSLKFTNSIEGLINDFVNGASDEREFKVGILDVLIKARDDFFGKIPKPATKEMINFLLVNALRHLSKEQQIILAKEISDRASEARVEPKVIKKMTDIPKEFKCARCKKDLRDSAKNPCKCNGNDGFTGNKSGGQFMRTTIDYKQNG